MTPSAPRLTIGLPVYNGERYLEGAVESILGQTYADFELLIADNASSDATEPICRELSRLDNRVRYVRHNENIGVAANHNFAVEAAKGELFRWAADDDLIMPSGLEKCVDLLDEAGPQTVLSFPQTEVVDEDGNHLRQWAEQGSVDDDEPDTRLRALLEHPTGHLQCGFLPPFYGIVRTSVLRSTRLLRYFFAADIVLVVELALRGKLAEVPEPLYVRRQHAAQSGGWSTSTDLERSVWAYPGFRGPAMPRSRVVKGYIEAILEAPLTSGERRRCLAAVAASLFRDGTVRTILGELREAAAMALKSRMDRVRGGGDAA
jgi:glycosyltransferase involved in cell wall biosynthesis